ncbi:MAG: CDP-glycerol glycerophosphotransferase family protein [Candidatus Yanofskybacteria bacterium]|nr:CDP-glycerol glycerophosphotransferase family protein [Candidatus Yanofskybacteria bacterium]
MKTIFLTTFDMVQIRNFLRTEFYDIMRHAPIRVVLFVPRAHTEYYRKEFGAPNIIIEGVDQPRRTRVQFFLLQAAQVALRTDSVWSYYVQRARALGNWKRYLYYLVAYTLLANRIGHRILRAAFSLAFSGRFLGPYFETYRPSLVFATNITAPFDHALVLEAKRRGIRTVGAVKSWDTMSMKGYLDIRTDVLLAQNHVQEREARDFHYVRTPVIVTGNPRLDILLDDKGIESRDAFFARMGLDPSKKVIFYFPAAKFINPFSDELLEDLDAMIGSGEIASHAQIFVTPRPKYESDIEGIRKLQHTVLYLPEGSLRGGAQEWERYSVEDMYLLKNCVHHADVVINATSSISVEAACMDRPVITTDYDLAPVDYWLSVRVRHTDEHFRTLLEMGGVAVAHSRAELIHLIRSYLADPSLDHEGRMRTLQQQNAFPDPHAARRIAKAILRELDNS